MDSRSTNIADIAEEKSPEPERSHFQTPKELDKELDKEPDKELEQATGGPIVRYKVGYVVATRIPPSKRGWWHLRPGLFLARSHAFAFARIRSWPTTGNSIVARQLYRGSATLSWLGGANV